MEGSDKPSLKFIWWVSSNNTIIHFFMVPELFVYVGITVSNRWRHLQQKASKKLRHLILFQLRLKRLGFFFLRIAWLFLAWKAEGGSDMKSSEESFLPSLTCSIPCFCHGTGDAGLPPALLTPLSEAVMGVCGQRLGGERTGRSGALNTTSPSDSLKKTSGWARGCLKIYFRTAIGHGLSLNLIIEVGSLQIRVWGCP